MSTVDEFTGPLRSLAVAQSPVLWKTVHADGAPKQRSLHVGVTVGDAMFIFGGYDGSSRLNDLHRFDFATSTWTQIVASNGTAPSPRDRLVGMAHKDSLYIFGGYDGTNRVNDLWRFDSVRNSWHFVDPIGTPPSARHSHSAVEYEGKLFVVFGYDGNYKADIHEFSIARKTWVAIQAKGTVPRPRYRSSCVVHGESLWSFGGHDGFKHLDDLHCFNFKSNTWTLVEPVSPLVSMGPYAFRPLSPGAAAPPANRDSHSAVIHGDSMFVFGGSTGAARNDLFEYRIDLNAWIEIQPHSDTACGGRTSATTTNLATERSPLLRASTLTTDQNPCPRFCHVAVVYRDCMFVHAGYDGQARLGDLKSYSFVENVLLDVPPPTILHDIKSSTFDPLFADVVFVVDGEHISGHKVILARCSYFRAMFESAMAERAKSHIEIHDVPVTVFKTVVSYLYTDEVADPLEDPMGIFSAADRFGIDRLKRICEQSILSSISNETACTILQAADTVNAAMLRKRAIEYILRHYDSVVKTTGFEDLARRNIELTLEIIRQR